MLCFQALYCRASACAHAEIFIDQFSTVMEIYDDREARRDQNGKKASRTDI
jgi:hypothetical protein